MAASLAISTQDMNEMDRQTDTQPACVQVVSLWTAVLVKC